MAFQIRRGTNSERQGITPSEGELIYTTDTKKLFVGDGTSAGGNPVEYFSKIRVNAVDVVPDNVNLGTITLAAGTGITLAADIITDTITINSTTAQAESFKTISISGQSNIVADTNTDTLTLVAGSNITLTTDPTTDSITIASTSNYFSTIAVAGNSNIVADSATDTLTLVAGSNITLTTDPTTDSITIAASGGASSSFATIAVSGQGNVVANSSTDTLTLVAGSNITLTTDPTTDSITIAAASGGASSSFKTISVFTQGDVVANSSTDTLTLVAGSNITLTTDPTTDSITIASQGSPTFKTISVFTQGDVVADSATDTLTLVAGSNITLTTDPTTDSITIASTSNYFSTIAVAGNSNIVADSATDTLTLIAGTGITINTDSLLDSITINGANSFSTIAVTGQNNIIAETNSSQLRFVAGNNVNITTDDITDSITFSLPSTLYSNIIGNTTGYHSGDVKGSVFGDDSSEIIDAYTSSGSFTNLRISSTLIGTQVSQLYDSLLDTDNDLLIVGPSSTSSGVYINAGSQVGLAVRGINDGSGNSTSTRFITSRGSMTSRTSLQTSDVVHSIIFSGHNGADLDAVSLILGEVDTKSSASLSGLIRFGTRQHDGSYSQATFDAAGVFAAPVLRVSSTFTTSPDNRPAGAAVGTIIFETTTNTFQGWNGTSWITLG